MSNKMTKEQLIALQEEIDKMGGREKYVVSELNRRGIKIEQKLSLIKLVQQETINAQRLFPGSDAEAQKQRVCRETQGRI